MSWTMNISHDVITHQHVVPELLEEEGEAMAVGSSCNREINTRKPNTKVVIKQNTWKLWGRDDGGRGRCNSPSMILNTVGSHEGAKKLRCSLPFHYFKSIF
jgi:hypothetical protein